MEPVHLFVEGDDDAELVRALLIREGLDHPGVSLSTLGGYTNLWSEKEAHPVTLLRNTQSDPPVRNLIITDADFPHNAGGLAARRQEIERRLNEQGIEFALFLVPDDARDGMLETLIEDLVQPQHRQILRCFDNYEACLAALVCPGGKSYRTPPPKSRAFVYVDTLPLTDEERQRKEAGGRKKQNLKFFGNADYWNLDAAALDPLKDFLRAHVR